MATIEERLKDAPPRLIILAACGFARTVEHFLTDKRSRVAIETAERFADRQATEEEVEAAEEAAYAAALTTEEAAYAAWGAAKAARLVAEAAKWAITVRVSMAAGKALPAAKMSADVAQLEAEGASAAANTASAAEVAVGKAEAAAVTESILDCILSPRIQLHFPAHVVGLATTIYQKRDWSLMLILADALEEIGQAEMAGHCRQPIHAKGCHVLDSILGLH